MNKILSEIPISERPYRSCVGLMVFNKDGNVFCGQRLDNKAEAWQLPQGGIDVGELPIEAGFRELKEETSIISVEFVSEFPEWLNYDIPLPLADNLWEGKYRGQKQKWFITRFLGDENEINLNTKHAEFIDWKWIEPKLLPKVIVSFKKDLYLNLLKEINTVID